MHKSHNALVSEMVYKCSILITLFSATSEMVHKCSILITLFSATWDVAYNSCRLLSTDDIFEKYHRHRKQFPAWTKSTVLLSDWTSFIGMCLNKMFFFYFGNVQCRL